MVKKKIDLKYYEAIGRRKTAVARVRLYIADKQKEIVVGKMTLKKGDVFINERLAADYFPGSVLTQKFMVPLTLTENTDRFAISVHVAGGGINGQVDAVVLGIARALEKVDKDLRAPLKKDGLFTRDPRKRQRRMIGMGGKSRRKKQSPKR
jgi:small subunit ribosomal protein S9